MILHLDDRLMDFVLGSLPPTDLAELERHVAACTHCQREVATASEALAELGSSLPVVTPSRAGRDRILAAVGPVEPVRGLRHAERLAEFFDLPPEVGRALLEKASVADSWLPGPVAGVSVIRVLAGAGCGGADTVLVQIDGGLTLAPHVHEGREHTLILDGAMHFEDGGRLLAGEIETRVPGSGHTITVPPEGCLCALILHGGLIVEGHGTIRLVAR